MRTGTLQNSQTGICLHNLIEVKSSCVEPFAKFGDSGALVCMYHDNNDNDLRADGIIAGGTDDGHTVFITPIFQMLKDLGLSKVNRLKTFSHEPMEIDESETPDQGLGIEHKLTKIEVEQNMFKTEFKSVKDDIKSVKSEVTTEMKSVKDDLKSVKDYVTTELRSVKDDVKSVKNDVKSILSKLEELGNK